MGDLRGAFDESVEASRLIASTDAALVQSGRTIADQLDYAVENLSGQELTKALYLTPHLLNILREMLATPASRKSAGVKDEDAGANKLAAVRNIRDRKAPSKKRSNTA